MNHSEKLTGAFCVDDVKSVTVAQKAIELTTQFYATVADSFAETRTSAWTGWQRVLELGVSEVRQPFEVLDVACGNMRFERFLETNGVNVRSACAVDNCLQLVKSGMLQYFAEDDAPCVLAEGSALDSPAEDGSPAASAEDEVSCALAEGSARWRAAECDASQALVECKGCDFSFPVYFRQIDILQALSDGSECDSVGGADSKNSTGTVFVCGSDDFTGSAGSGSADNAGDCDVSRETFLGDRDFNLSVCFGFMHHIPKFTQRLELLKSLILATQPGGIVAVSFWQFANSDRLIRKARETTERASRLLNIRFENENDYLLGWKDEQNVFRYCHNYTEEEIDELVGSLERQNVQCAQYSQDLPHVRQIARFSSDGAEGNLNRYVVLKVEGR